VIPRDAPIFIFVKIIHFIAQQKLDFAFKEIIFDLLGANRASRTVQIYPERMNIGVRFLLLLIFFFGIFILILKLFFMSVFI
jgi:hypothetical protein